MYGLVMRRSRPARPARISKRRPSASERPPSSAPTVTPGEGVMGRVLESRTQNLSRLGLNQRQLAVAAVEDADRRPLPIVEDDQIVVPRVDRARRFGHPQPL